MANESLTMDSTGTALSLWQSSGIKVVDARYPAPPHKVEYANSIDTEGGLPAEASYENREIDVKLMVHSQSTSTFLNNLKKLQRKVGLWQREGGVLTRVTSTGLTAKFDVTNAQIDIPADRTFVQQRHAEVGLTFEALPFARSTETVSSASTTANPIALHTLSAVAGDVPALGRLIITEASTKDQLSMMWGARQKNYSTSATQLLFYEAESRTLQGGAAKANSTAWVTTFTAAQCSGSQVIRSTGLTPTYQSILATPSTASVHLQHIGRYRVWARAITSTSVTSSTNIKLKFAWSEGDFTQWTENDPVEAVLVDNPFIVDLGTINLRKVASGTQRWQGRFLAKTEDGTLADSDLGIDCFWFQPLDEGSGKLFVTPQAPSPTSLAAHDEFNQSTGTLSGKTAPQGGNWSSTGSTHGDFSVTV